MRSLWVTCLTFFFLLPTVVGRITDDDEVAEGSNASKTKANVSHGAKGTSDSKIHAHIHHGADVTIEVSSDPDTKTDEQVSDRAEAFIEASSDVTLNAEASHGAEGDTQLFSSPSPSAQVSSSASSRQVSSSSSSRQVKKRVFHSVRVTAVTTKTVNGRVVTQTNNDEQWSSSWSSNRASGNYPERNRGQHRAGISRGIREKKKALHQTLTQEAHGQADEYHRSETKWTEEEIKTSQITDVTKIIKALEARHTEGTTRVQSSSQCANSADDTATFLAYSKHVCKDLMRFACLEEGQEAITDETQYLVCGCAENALFSDSSSLANAVGRYLKDGATIAKELMCVTFVEKDIEEKNDKSIVESAFEHLEDLDCDGGEAPKEIPIVRDESQVEDDDPEPARGSLRSIQKSRTEGDKTSKNQPGPQVPNAEESVAQDKVKKGVKKTIPVNPLTNKGHEAVTGLENSKDDVEKRVEVLKGGAKNEIDPNFKGCQNIQSMKAPKKNEYAWVWKQGTAKHFKMFYCAFAKVVQVRVGKDRKPSDEMVDAGWNEQHDLLKKKEGLSSFLPKADTCFVLSVEMFFKLVLEGAQNQRDFDAASKLGKEANKTFHFGSEVSDKIQAPFART